MNAAGKVALGLALLVGMGLITGGVVVLMREELPGIPPAAPPPEVRPVLQDRRPAPPEMPPSPPAPPPLPPRPSSPLLRAGDDGAIRVVVRDQDGKPVEEATVSVSSVEADRAARSSREIGRGIHEVTGLPRGEYVVRCRAPVDPEGRGLTKAETRVALERYGETRVAAFTLPRPGRISVEGRVGTSSGSAGDIDVVFDAPAFEAHARTGPDGAYRVTHLPPGPYTVRCLYRDEASGASADLATHTLEITGSIPYNPYLEVGSVELKIADAAGLSAAGRRVEILRFDRMPGEGAAVGIAVAAGAADEAGVLRLRYAPAGLYTIVVEGAVAEPAEIALFAGATSRTISVRAPRAPDER